MLNLSDKELDRLSKEAAQEYEPGDVLGPNAWEKLEMRLDSDLGRVSPNPLRHIRRFPFYYAPLLLVLLGISYYYLTKHPPTSHDLVKNSSNTQIPKYSTNSTPSANSSANPNDATSAPRPSDEAGSAAATGVSKRGAPAAAGGGVRVPGGAAAPASAAVPGGAAAPESAAAPGGAAAPESAAAPGGKGAATRVGTASPGGRNATEAARGDVPRSAGASVSSASPTRGLPHRRFGAGSSDAGSAGVNGRRHPDNGISRQTGGLNDKETAAAPTTSSESELMRSTLQGLRPTRQPVFISDSALRAFTLKSTPPGPIRRNMLYIKRNWQFGIVAAPDFASVNSLAGDKPGSTFGLTVDYQLAPRWYIGSGLLLDRRNYAARSQDFHAPMSFYTSFNPNNVDFVKGSFQMLEIPLNLRYDFSVTGSTLFFASAGVSSYVLTTDNGNCYVNWYGQEVPKGFHYPGPGNYLFSAMNLSLGVETGLSNSISLLVAPYMKMPLRTIGFGQVQMSSVGISFSVKWAPVTSRKRR